MQSDLNTIAGNYIGTDATGTQALGNYIGVQVTGGSNTIGGSKPAARNVISASQDAGISLQFGSATVQGNYIGLDATGTVPLGNSYGIQASYTSNLLIGGSAAARNVISGNLNDGISLLYLYGPATIQGNYIGTDATGTIAIGNGTPGPFSTGYGIDVFSSNDVTIGGNAAGKRNVIAANQLGGIAVESTSSGTTITGNYIGTDSTGKVALGNQGAGVLLTGLITNTMIGGATAGLRNVIAANQIGIHVADGTSGTTIQGNYLGTDSTGKLPLGNTAQGILIDGGSTGTLVGAVTAGAGNVIAFNGDAGVAVAGAGSVGNSIRGNSVFGNLGLGIDLAADVGGPAVPALTRVVFGAVTRVIGTYTGAANTTILIDLYASPTADPTGFGEGKRYLGTISVTTDASGLASFDVSLAVFTKAGEMIAATATDTAGTTSPFSLAVKAAK